MFKLSPGILQQLSGFSLDLFIDGERYPQKRSVRRSL